MALYNEILVGRFNRGLQKFLSIKGGPPAPQRPMSLEQTIEHVLELRERYGITYLQIQTGQMENFAPVVARLAGK